MLDLVVLAEQALLLGVLLSLPVVGLAALVGLLTGALQAMTQIQDTALAHLPRLVAVALGLALAAPWMGAELVAFATRAFGGG